MKTIIRYKAGVFLLLAALSPLHAIKEAVPDKDYNLRIGLSNTPVVFGEELKKNIDGIPAPAKVVSTPASTEVDFTNAFILKQIKESKNLGSVENVGQLKDMIVLPAAYQKELAAYDKAKKAVEDGKGSSVDTKIEKLLLLQCSTFRDYKINNETNIKMFCRDPKSLSKLYKVSAGVNVENKILTSSPYLVEDDEGVIYDVVTGKSKLFNASSGSSNLATFVDKRAIEQVVKATTGDVAVTAPMLTKDYIAQKNKADSTVFQDNNGLTTATTTQTISPEPQASDYGISLLISAIGSGLKAGADQLYMDLGYIYFIPKDTVIDAEIIIKVDNKNE